MEKPSTASNEAEIPKDVTVPEQVAPASGPTTEPEVPTVSPSSATDAEVMAVSAEPPLPLEKVPGPAAEAEAVEPANPQTTESRNEKALAEGVPVAAPEFATHSEAAVEQTPEIFQPPQKRVSPLFQFVFFFANLSIWLAKFPFTSIILPLQILALDPGNKTLDFSLITAVGSLFGLIANPLAGALSDRTTNPLGRRRPWLISGVIMSVVMLVVLSFSPGVIGLLIGWILYQIAINVVLSALMALLPDRVPQKQRGLVSSYTGLAIPLGFTIGVQLITRSLRQAIQPTYYIIGAILLIAILLVVVITPEQQLPKHVVPAFNLRSFLGSFWLSPRRYPDFGWAWLTRFLIILSSSAVTLYTLYYLQDVYKYSSEAAAKGVATFTTTYSIVLVVTAISCGLISDRIGRRKIFVVAAGILTAISMFILAFAHTNALFITAAVIFGLGYGGYLGVDFALVSEVLPSKKDHAKDLGVFNIANSLPQVIMPTLGAIILSAFGNSYFVLFTIVGVAALFSGLLIQPIKSIR